MRSPVGFGAVAQGEGGAGVGGAERLAEFVERTCHGLAAVVWRGAELHARIARTPDPRTGLSPKATGRTRGAARSPAEQEIGLRPNPALNDSTHRSRFSPAQTDADDAPTIDRPSPSSALCQLGSTS